MKIRALAFVCLAVAGESAAQERAAGADTLYVTGHLDSGVSDGGGAEVEWLRAVTPGTSLLLGGASAAMDDLRWIYVTAGGFTRTKRAILSARGSAGSSTYLDDGFAYVRLSGTATIPVAPRLYAEGEVQYVRIVGQGTTVVRLGGVYAGPRALAVRLTYNHTGTAQRAHAGSLSGRADLTLRRVSLFGGVTMSGIESFQPPAIDLVAHATQESFFGSSVDVGRSQVIAALQVVPRTDGRFSRMTATLRLPLGARTTATPGVAR